MKDSKYVAIVDGSTITYANMNYKELKELEKSICKNTEGHSGKNA